ncbi:MAG: Ig-like domain-containing protein, partial [Oscillospiraceae bacterium]|nr:Ig-like domain-containing protein [Oscillospiraceae bacterium]
MKKNLKRTLAFILVIVLMTALCASAFAVGEDELEYNTYDEYEEPVVVVLSPSYVTMQVKDKTTLTAYVEGDGAGARYEWRSSNPGAVSVSGSGKSATITAVSAGHAEVMLTVTSADGLRSDYDYAEVDVSAAYSPVSVSGGTSLTLDEGAEQKITAGVSGGSGSYVYEWETDGSGVINVTDTM